MSEESDQEEEVEFNHNGIKYRMPKEVLRKALNLKDSDNFDVKQNRIVVRTEIGKLTVGAAIKGLKKALDSDEYGVSACQNKSCSKAKQTGWGCGNQYKGRCKKCDIVLCDDCPPLCHWCDSYYQSDSE